MNQPLHSPQHPAPQEKTPPVMIPWEPPSAGARRAAGNAQGRMQPNQLPRGTRVCTHGEAGGRNQEDPLISVLAELVWNRSLSCLVF